MPKAEETMVTLTKEVEGKTETLRVHPIDAAVHMDRGWVPVSAPPRTDIGRALEKKARKDALVEGERLKAKHEKKLAGGATVAGLEDPTDETKKVDDTDETKKVDETNTDANQGGGKGGPGKSGGKKS